MFFQLMSLFFARYYKFSFFYSPMIIATHLIITAFFALLFAGDFSSKEFIIFIAVALFSTYLPDIDSKFSSIGKIAVFRPFQWFVRHRSLTHSAVFLSAVCFILQLIHPFLTAPFALGYGLHILADGFTKHGVRVFYPLNWKLRGVVKTGGLAEALIFAFFLAGTILVVLKNLQLLF